MWAEDGREFVAAAVRKGSLAPLLTGYSGYAHVVPRLLAAIVAAVPIEDAAAVTAVLACVVTASLAVFCARASAGHLTMPASRVAYALAFALLPVAAVEALGNLANLHWFLFVAAFWALLWRPATWIGVVTAAVVVALAVLSDPLVLLLAPLALWRVVTLPALRDRAVVIALAAAATVQLLVVVRSQRPTGEVAFGSLPGLFAERIGLGSMLGVKPTTHFVSAAGTTVAIALGIAIVIALTWVAGKTAATGPAFAVTTVVVASGLFLACVAIRGGSHELVNGVVAGGSRYAVAPTLILLAPIIATLERSRGSVRAGAIVVALVVCVVDLRPYNLRSGDLSWARGVATARTQCRHGFDPAELPTLPLTPNGEWEMELPCSYVQPSEP